jgi:hypothetical protein
MYAPVVTEVRHSDASQDDFPDLYGDGIQVGVGNYGVTLSLLLSNPEVPDKLGPVIGRFRISRELARTLSNILTEQINKLVATEAAMVKSPAKAKK